MPLMRSTAKGAMHDESLKTKMTDSLEDLVALEQTVLLSADNEGGPVQSTQFCYINQEYFPDLQT